MIWELPVVALRNMVILPGMTQNIDVGRAKSKRAVDEAQAADRRVLLLTGPNMAGKSTYLRTAALCALLHQIGSFVPADRAELPVYDAIHTRIGASDDLAGGRSTFMVEMTELAAILHAATHRSLVILDEVGRGTSTLDGLAIAQAAPTPWIRPSCTSVSASSAFAPSCTVLNEPLSAKPSALARARISKRGSAREKAGAVNR